MRNVLLSDGELVTVAGLDHLLEIAREKLGSDFSECLEEEFSGAVEKKAQYWYRLGSSDSENEIDSWRQTVLELREMAEDGKKLCEAKRLDRKKIEKAFSDIAECADDKL